MTDLGFLPSLEPLLQNSDSTDPTRDIPVMLLADVK